MRVPKILKRQGPFALGLLGIAMSLWPAIVSQGRTLPGDPGDVRLCQYIMEHSFLWLTRTTHHLILWDPPFFYPHRNVFAYSDTLLGVAPLYWLGRGLRFTPDVSLLFWFMAVLGLNYAVAYQWLRRQFSLIPMASALGAFMVAFGSARLSQINHPQLTPIFYVILAVQGLGMLFRGQLTELPSGRAGRGVGLFFTALALQLWTDFYMTWFLIMGVFVAAIWGMRGPARRAHLWKVLWSARKPIAWSAVLSLIVVLPALWHYAAAAVEVGQKDFGMVKPWLPRPASWLFMGRGSWVYGWQEHVRPWRALIENGIAHEHAMGWGWVSLVVSIFGLRSQWRNAEVRILGTIVIISVVSTTLFIPHVTLWGILYEILPGATALRALARICLILMVPLGLGIALFFDRAAKNARNFRSRVGIGMLAAFCLLEQGHRISTYDAVAVEREMQVFVNALNARSHCQFFFLNPFDTQKSGQPWRFQTDALWVGIRTGIPTLNGYTGSFPAGWAEDLFQAGKLEPDYRAGQRHSLQQWMRLNNLAEDGLCQIEPTL